MIIAIIILIYDCYVNIILYFRTLASRGEPSRLVRLSPACALLVLSQAPAFATGELDANTIYRRVSTQDPPTSAGEIGLFRALAVTQTPYRATLASLPRILARMNQS